MQKLAGAVSGVASNATKVAGAAVSVGSSAATSAATVVTGAAGSAGSTVKSVLVGAVISLLKRKIEGQTQIVSETPEVLVTVEELLLPDKLAGIQIDLNHFKLEGLEVRTCIEVRGTAAELAALAAGKAVDSVKQHDLVQGAGSVASAGMSRVSALGASAAKATRMEAATGAVAGAVTGVAAGAYDVAGAGAAKLAGAVNAPLPDSRSVQISVVVDLVKQRGVEDVLVTIREFKTDLAIVEALLTPSRARQYIENTISAKASEAVTQIARENTPTLEGAKRKTSELAKDAKDKIASVVTKPSSSEKD